MFRIPSVCPQHVKSIISEERLGQKLTNTIQRYYNGKKWQKWCVCGGWGWHQRGDCASLHLQTPWCPGPLEENSQTPLYLAGGSSSPPKTHHLLLHRTSLYRPGSTAAVMRISWVRLLHDTHRTSIETMMSIFSFCVNPHYKKYFQ